MKCPQCYQIGRVSWVSQDGKKAAIQCPGSHSQIVRENSKFGSTDRRQTKSGKNMVFLIEIWTLQSFGSHILVQTSARKSKLSPKETVLPAHRHNYSSRLTYRGLCTNSALKVDDCIRWLLKTKSLPRQVSLATDIGRAYALTAKMHG